jgi:hypothetical protein
MVFLISLMISQKSPGLSLRNKGKDMKRLVTLSLIFALCSSGATPCRAQGQSPDPVSGKETVQSETAKSPGPKAKKKFKSGSSPQAQIKEGGKEIGLGFRDLFRGIGRGFQNMGSAIKKAWTGDSGN